MLKQTKLVLASVGLGKHSSTQVSGEGVKATIFCAHPKSGSILMRVCFKAFLAAILASFIGPGLDREIITCSP